MIEKIKDGVIIILGNQENISSNQLMIASAPSNNQSNNSSNLIKSLSCKLNRITMKDLKLIDKIGEGEFGCVYSGMLTVQNKQKVSYSIIDFNILHLYKYDLKLKVNVAIKHLKTGGNFFDFIREAKIMGSIDHPCIINVYGICFETQMIVKD